MLNLLLGIILIDNYPNHIAHSSPSAMGLVTSPALQHATPELLFTHVLEVTDQDTFVFSNQLVTKPSTKTNVMVEEITSGVVLSTNIDTSQLAIGKKKFTIVVQAKSRNGIYIDKFYATDLDDILVIKDENTPISENLVQIKGDVVSPGGGK